MCEFKIIVKEGEKKTAVADGIVYGKVRDGNILFSGLGVDKEIQGGLITELNVIAEESPFIQVIKSPIISEFLAFMNKYEKLKEGKDTNLEIKREWEKTSDHIKNIIS
jgi:hypothetical protein